MVIFNSYVKLPAGMFTNRKKTHHWHHPALHERIFGGETSTEPMWGSKHSVVLRQNPMGIPDFRNEKYKAYFSGLCKRISPQNMARNMVLTYLHFRILKFPLIMGHLK